MEIYLDHAATTCVDERVLEKMLPYFSGMCGNTASMHTQGRAVAKAVRSAREQLAAAIGACAEDIYFTSGGTESDNWALVGAMEAAGKGHIITSTVEHHAVLETCAYLEARGFAVTYVPVDGEGAVAPNSVRDAIRTDTILISIMYANNETGAIMPVHEIAALAAAYGIPFHTDAVQAVGHVPVNVSASGISMLSLSAHKFYGPKGVGALYVRSGCDIARYMRGGMQERGLRAGTCNTPGIVGMGKAVTLATAELEDRSRAETALRDRLWAGISVLPVRLNGPREGRLPGHLNVHFEGVEAAALLMYLDKQGICVSTGAACSAGSSSPSHVLIALGLSEEEAKSCIRFSLGNENTQQHIDSTVDAIKRFLNYG